MLLRRVALAGFALVCLPSLACRGPVHGESQWSSMDTTASATVYMRDSRGAELALSEIRATIERAANALDPRSEAGDLARLNRAARDEYHPVPGVDLYACLHLALDYARVSHGAYDPTAGVLRRLYEARHGTGNPPRPAEIDIAMSNVGWEKVALDPEAHRVRFRAPGLEIDLGAVAFGCAVDWASRTFARPGSLGGLIRWGDVYRAWQRPPGQDAWRVRLPDPREPGRELLSVRVVDRGVAVCGQPDPAMALDPAAPRPPLDPRSGRPVASDLLAVVTTADSSADAAGLCRALQVAGSLEGPEILRKMRRVEALLLVRADAARPYVVASASLAGRLESSPELDREIEGDVRFLLP